MRGPGTSVALATLMNGPRRRPRCLDGDSGVSLVEVLLAAGVLAVALVALAQLLAGGVRAGVDTRGRSYSSILAAQKMEELLALTLSVDATGRPVTDVVTDTTTTPPSDAGGTGLTPSPSESLRSNTPGYVDHVDSAGRKMGGAVAPPSGAAYTRRWSIEPVPSEPSGSLVIQVSVRLAVGVDGRDGPEGARLVTIRTRTR